MSTKFLLIGVIILVILVLLFMFYQYKKTSRAKRGLVSDSPDQGFLKTIDYSIDLKNSTNNKITFESIPVSPQRDLLKIIDGDYTSTFTFKNNQDESNIYIIKVNFSQSVYLRKIRIYSGYRTGTDWSKVNISSYTGNKQDVLEVNGVSGEYNNTVVRYDNFSYFDFTEIILDPAAVSSPSYRLTFTSSNPPVIREIVFLGYLDRGRDVEKELNSIKLNGFIVKPLISQIPSSISDMFGNFYDKTINYSQLLTYKKFDSNINKDMIRLEVPFDKIYSFYKIIIYYDVKENVGFDIIRVSGYNHVIDDSFIEAPPGVSNERYKQVLMFLPIMDNKLVLDFINPNENLSIINIAFYGFEVQLAYYDQILISNPKQQNIKLSEIEVYNEKFENILPSSVDEGKAVVLQTPTNSELVSRIEIIKDVTNVPFVPDPAYTATYKEKIILTLSNFQTYELKNPPKYFGSLKNIIITFLNMSEAYNYRSNFSKNLVRVYNKNINNLNQPNDPTLISQSTFNMWYNSVNTTILFPLENINKNNFNLKFKAWSNPEWVNGIWTETIGDWSVAHRDMPNPQRLTTQVLLVELEYYIDYRYMLQIQEIPIFKFNNDGTSSLFPKMNQNNKENYRILANGSKNLVATNMIDYALSPYPEFDSYYKSNIYSNSVRIERIYITLIPSIIKEFRIKLKSNQRFHTNGSWNCSGQEFIRDKYVICGSLHGDIYGRSKDLIGEGGDQIISIKLQTSFSDTISNIDVTNGNTKTFNIINIINSQYSNIINNFMNNKKFVLKKINIEIEGVTGNIKIPTGASCGSMPRVDYDFCESSQIAIDKIMLYDNENNMINQGDINISSSTYNTDGTIDNLYDNNESTYWRSDRSPVKLFILFNTPIPLDKINIINAPSNSFFYKNMKDVTIKFYNFKNQVINSFEITEPRPTYEFKNLNKVSDSYNIMNLYDNNLNSYTSTFPEIDKYRQDISGLRIIGPYILIFFNRPTLLTGVKINNVKSMFLNYKGQEQADNTIFGLFVQATLGARWSSKNNTSTPFKCIKDVYDLPYQYEDASGIMKTEFVKDVNSINAYRINNNISECYSTDRNTCKNFQSIRDCERELQILVPNFNKACGTASGIDDCLYYQKNIKDNTLCLNVKNNKYIKILNTIIDKNTNSFGCKKDNNLCKEYDSLQTCKSDTIISSDLLNCNNNMIDNPNHWCSKASNLLFDNLYQTPIKVFDISGSGLFPMYCQMDIKDLGCQTKVEEWNSKVNQNEIIYEGPSSNVYVANITSIPYDSSGNIPFTNLVYKTDIYMKNIFLNGQISYNNINDMFVVPSNIENIDSLNFYYSFRIGGPDIITDTRTVNVTFSLIDNYTEVMSSNYSISAINSEKDTYKVLTFPNPSVLLNYKNKKLSLQIIIIEVNVPFENRQTLSLILSNMYFILKYRPITTMKEKYSTQIVDNPNYLNCEEVANLIASKKNWSVNKIDYDKRKVVFTKSCS